MRGCCYACLRAFPAPVFICQCELLLVCVCVYVTAGDLITVYFTKMTNSVNVSTAALLSPVLSVSPWLATNMSGQVCDGCARTCSPTSIHACACVCVQWFAGGDSEVPDAAQRLVITLFGVMNPDPLSTIPSDVNVTILSSGNITDVAGSVILQGVFVFDCLLFNIWLCGGCYFVGYRHPCNCSLTVFRATGAWRPSPTSFR